MLYKWTEAALVQQAISVTKKEFMFPMHHYLLVNAHHSPRKLMQNFLDKYDKFNKAARKMLRT